MTLRKTFHHLWLGLWYLALVLPLRAEPPPAAPPIPKHDWEPAKETLVLFNSDSESSQSLAAEYAALRHIPAERVVGFPMSNQETISRDDFENTIKEPLLRHLIEHKWWRMEKRTLLDPNGRSYAQLPQVVQQDIRVLVIIRGVPLRINRTANSSTKPGEQDEASVDSELAGLGLLSRSLSGAVENRYYQSGLRFPDRHEAKGQLLVGRLDAADDATVRRMMKDTIKAEQEGLWGRAVIDFSLMDGGYLEGEQWLGRTVALYREQGIPVFTDRYKEVLRDAWPLPDTILYFGWYTDRAKGAIASPSFRFKRGAIACHLHSFSCATLRDKTQNWCAPILDKGAAATMGNVWEPYLALTIHFDILNARLLEGYTLGEASWAAIPGLSWMNVVLGDPLYVPFPKGRARTSQDEKELDYVMYYDLIKRYLPHDGKKLRRELLRIAEEKDRPTLLEFAALLCTVEESFGQAVDFLQHAQALYARQEDKLRCALYEVDAYRRMGKSPEIVNLVKTIIGQKVFNPFPAFQVATALQTDLGLKTDPSPTKP